MGTGVIEDRAPPLREDRPPREAPSFSRDEYVTCSRQFNWNLKFADT